MKGLAGASERAIHWLSRRLNQVGMVLLLVMMFLSTADVSLRYFLNSPILGANEGNTYLQVVLVSFGLAYTMSTGGHVSVTLLVDRFPRRLQALIDILTGLAGLGLWALILWQSFLNIQDTRLSGEVSIDLMLPMFLVKAPVPIGAFFLCLEMVVTVGQSLALLFARTTSPSSTSER
jgi:TRAP-type C4-dicarboxylate transport system permease small subunit